MVYNLLFGWLLWDFSLFILRATTITLCHQPQRGGQGRGVGTAIISRWHHFLYVMASSPTELPPVVLQFYANQDYGPWEYLYHINELFVLRNPLSYQSGTWLTTSTVPGAVPTPALILQPWIPFSPSPWQWRCLGARCSMSTPTLCKDACLLCVGCVCFKCLRLAE